MSSVKATREREMQTVQDEWLKEPIHHQDMRVTVEEHEEHIYEEPPEVSGKVLSFVLLVRNLQRSGIKSLVSCSL